jgi:flagellar hook-associated protein 2
MLAEATAPATGGAGTGGPLRGDLSIRQMQRELGRLTSTVLNTSGGPSTLAEIGVATNRDGTLRVDSAQLDKMLESDPDGVEALFNPRQYSDNPLVTIFSKAGAAAPGTYTLTNLVPDSGSGATGSIDGLAMISSGPNLIAPVNSAAIGLVVTVLGSVSSATITIDSGLGGALQEIRDTLRARTGPMSIAQDRLEAEAEDIAEDRAALEARAEAYHDQLVQSFTAMDLRVTALKATQSYLDQQIKMWSSGND